MRLKVRPGDFQVEEDALWTPDPEGRFQVYRLRKVGRTTDHAVRALELWAGRPRGSIGFAGLKDRRAQAAQIVSVEGVPLPAGKPPPGIAALEWLGRSATPIATGDVRRNRFRVVVRDLAPADVRRARSEVPALALRGLPDYFDDQRFGAILHGQGFLARDLLLGRHERAVRRLVAIPSPRDPPLVRQAKLEASRRFGDFAALARSLEGAPVPYASMLRHLARRSGDFAGAFQHLDARVRTLHLFSYQSYLWNSAVARLIDALSRESGRAPIRVRYACGELVFPHPGDERTAAALESIELPLPDASTRPADARARAALDAALAAEGLRPEDLSSTGVRGCFLRETPRPIMVRPEELRLAGPRPDALHRGRSLAILALALRSGSYATLFAKRLFGAEAGSATLRRGPEDDERALDLAGCRKTASEESRREARDQERRGCR